MFKTLRRTFSTLTASALVLGFVAFTPGALAAASIKFSPNPATKFNITTQDKMDFTVGMSGSEGNAQLVNFSIKGPLANNPVTKDMGNKNYVGDMAQIFSWDGKFDGVDVKPGEYQAIFEGPTTIDWEFQVVTAEPILTFNPEPSNTYNIGSGDYNVSVALSQYGFPTDVKFNVFKKGTQVKHVADQDSFLQNGTLQFTWNGKINGNDPEVGTYVIEFAGKDTDGNTTTLTKEIEVKNQVNPIAPEIDFVNTPANEYEVDSGDYEVNVELTEYTSDTLVELFLLNPDNNLYIPKDNFTFTSENQTRVFTLTESDLEDFDYKVGDTVKFQLVGKDKANLSTSTLADSFKIVAESDESCAGYKDMKKTDKGCDAVTWAQDEGIMEGQGNGDFFDPNGILNRAQAARIALESYNEYNENTDYCKGKKPFPDVDLGLWYSEYVCRGVAIDMITGYEAGIYAGMFKPANNVSVIEAMALFLRPLNKNMPEGCSYAGLDCDEWYSGYAKYSKDKGLYPGNSLSPTKEMSRLEVAMFLYELHKDGEI